MFYQSKCLLSLCSRSCLHSALIDEVVATFTLNADRNKTREKLSILLLFFPTFIYFYLSTNVCFLCPRPFLVFASAQFNEFLCWHDSSVFMLLSVHTTILFLLSFLSLSFPLFRVSFPPMACLAVVESLRPQYYLACACFVHFSRAFFSSHAFSYLLRAHIVQLVIFNFRYVWQGVSCMCLLCIANEVTRKVMLHTQA